MTRSVCECDEKVECPCCKGRGERAFECEACAGTGEVRTGPADGDDGCHALLEGSWCFTLPRRPAAPERCRACGGRGHRFEACRACAGTGLLTPEEAEEIRQEQRTAQQRAAQRERCRADMDAELRARALRVWETEMQRLRAGEARRAPAGWRGWLLDFFTRFDPQPGREHAAGRTGDDARSG